ncbi:MAG TPA: hypothetical protein ENK18_07760 [Deltaproteobacteria bacterium]|nr:hypothetical protein [Deltaproteobacteria bacterium]
MTPPGPDEQLQPTSRHDRLEIVSSPGIGAGPRALPPPRWPARGLCVALPRHHAPTPGLHLDYDQLSAILVAPVEPEQVRTLSRLLAASLALALGALGLSALLEPSGTPVAGLGIGALVFGPSLLLIHYVSTHRITLYLDPHQLKIVQSWGACTLRRRTLPLRTLAAVHAIGTDTAPTPRGLQLVLQDGETLFLSAPALAPAELGWLAAQLRAVLTTAAPDAAMDPTLLELLGAIQGAHGGATGR